jgi:hypothetical protein
VSLKLKPLLVGESNPYNHDSYYALFPEPRGATGDRLCRLIMGISGGAYMAAFDRADLCKVRWSIKLARQEAERLKKVREPLNIIGPDSVSTFVLLGAKVCQAFDLKFEPYSYGLKWGGRYQTVILPHPSGINRAWHVPGAVERARMTLHAAGVMPSADEIAQGGWSDTKSRCSNCGKLDVVNDNCPDCGNVADAQ